MFVQDLKIGSVVKYNSLLWVLVAITEVATLQCVDDDESTTIDLNVEVELLNIDEFPKEANAAVMDILACCNEEHDCELNTLLFANNMILTEDGETLNSDAELAIMPEDIEDDNVIEEDFESNDEDFEDDDDYDEDDDDYDEDDDYEDNEDLKD